MPQEDVRNQVIRSGILPVDAVTGLPICPTPTEIICLKVDKVYNECKQTDVNNIPLGFPRLGMIILFAVFPPL